ncbi:MAG: hypothetical protein ABI251_11265, partial [Mycobacteriaceae bacterium]
MEYSFGTGVGPPTTWNSPADVDANGDGAPDAVALDFDGDGRVDDLMWDSNGDGVADTVVLDLDDDGHGERYYTDPTGAGTWNASVPPPARAPDGPVLRWVDPDGYRRSATATIDRDGDGIP